MSGELFFAAVKHFMDRYSLLGVEDLCFSVEIGFWESVDSFLEFLWLVISYGVTGPLAAWMKFLVCIH